MAFFTISALPLRTDRTLRAVPYVTYALCFLNLLIYLAGLPLSEYQLLEQSRHWGFTISHPTFLTLFTYAFLHADLFHLTGNLLILWLVGTVLEAGVGSLFFLLLYLAGQVTAILLYGVIGRAFYPDALSIPLIGASGAISGVTGFAAFRYFRVRVHTVPIVAFPPINIPLPLPVLVWVPLWAYAVLFAGKEVLAGLQEVLHGASGNVAHWAHIGGLGLGVLAALLLKSAQEGKREFAIADSAKAAGGVTTAKKSLRELEELRWERPDDPEILEAMGALALVKGDQERGRKCYLRAIPLFLAAGQAERAAVSYLNLLSADPDTVFGPREQMTIASALENLGHHRESAQAFLQVSARYPERDEAQTALLRAAQLHQKHLHDPGEAARLLRTLLDNYPHSPWHTLARERLREIAP